MISATLLCPADEKHDAEGRDAVVQKLFETLIPSASNPIIQSPTPTVFSYEFTISTTTFGQGLKPLVLLVYTTGYGYIDYPRNL